MISVICVYNDEQIFQACLLKSLSEQETDCEVIAIDNTKSRFRSAAEALNWGGSRATGNYLMFAHQDIDLQSDSWFDGTEELLDSLPDLGIAGVAGVRERDAALQVRLKNIRNQAPRHYRNVITQGPQKERWGNPIRLPEPVQTLDECLIIIPKSVFKLLQFDEATCSDWHLYAVDYCLSIKARGFGVYVLPKCLHHQSTGLSSKSSLQVLTSLGEYSPEYYLALERILKKHKNQYKWIHTSCGSWSVTYPFTLQRASHAFSYAIMSFLVKNLLSPWKETENMGR